MLNVLNGIIIKKKRLKKFVLLGIAVSKVYLFIYEALFTDGQNALYTKEVK